MKRREFITLLGGTAAWPAVARAEAQSYPDRTPFCHFGLHVIRELGRTLSARHNAKLQEPTQT